MPQKRWLIEKALDYLCKAADRDIFVMLPEAEYEQIPYLIAECRKTLTRIEEGEIDHAPEP